MTLLFLMRKTELREGDWTGSRPGAQAGSREHSPIYAVGSGQHPAVADEGASAHVLVLDLQAHLPGPLLL